SSRSCACAVQLLRFVFFYVFRRLRDLPSFPTRRSSDLVRVASGDRLDGPRIHRRLVDREPLAERAHPCVILIELLPAAQRPPWEDRKSTRLNSSHVKISYAVFCLKKKIIDKKCEHHEHE